MYIESIDFLDFFETNIKELSEIEFLKTCLKFIKIDFDNYYKEINSSQNGFGTGRIYLVNPQNDQNNQENSKKILFLTEREDFSYFFNIRKNKSNSFSYFFDLIFEAEGPHVVYITLKNPSKNIFLKIKAKFTNVHILDYDDFFTS